MKVTFKVISANLNTVASRAIQLLDHILLLHDVVTRRAPRGMHDWLDIAGVALYTLAARAVLRQSALCHTRLSLLLAFPCRPSS